MSSTIWGFVTPSTDSCLSVPVFWGKTRQGDPLRPDDRCRISIRFFIAIAVAVHKGNLFRTLISGSLIMTMTLWITNQTIPYIFVELFQRDNFAGLLVIGYIYIVCLAVSVQYSRAEKARSEDDTL